MLEENLSTIYELTDSEINSVNGGMQNWESIGYSVGSAIGWFYENVMIGDPW